MEPTIEGDRNGMFMHSDAGRAADEVLRYAIAFPLDSQTTFYDIIIETMREAKRETERMIQDRDRRIK